MLNHQTSSLISQAAVKQIVLFTTFVKYEQFDTQSIYQKPGDLIIISGAAFRTGAEFSWKPSWIRHFQPRSGFEKSNGGLCENTVQLYFHITACILSKISRFVKIRISDFSQKYFGRHDLIRRDHAPHIPRSPLFCTNSFWPVSEHTISIADIRSPDCNEIPMFRLSRLGDLAAGSLYSYFPLTFLSTSVLPNRRICIITRLTFILKFEHLPDSRNGYRLYVFQSAPQRFLGQIRHIAGISGLSEDRHCCRGFIFSR